MHRRRTDQNSQPRHDDEPAPQEERQEDAAARRGMIPPLREGPQAGNQAGRLPLGAAAENFLTGAGAEAGERQEQRRYTRPK